MEKLKEKTRVEEGRNKPNIRFPEFNGDWKQYYLGDLVFKTDKKNKENLNLPVYSINNTSGFVPQDEQFEGRNSQERGFDISIYKIINSNTFAYNPARINVGSIGYSFDLENILVSSLYVCFKTKENLDDNFLLQFFNTNTFRISVLRIQEGGVRQYLFFENLSKIRIFAPSIPEQKRIASFFTVVDKKIAELKQKKALLEQYKKGVMQKLFSQELRFKDENGKEFPKWEKRRLGDLVEINSGNSPSSFKLSNKGKFPFIKVDELNNSVKYQTLSREYADNAKGIITAHSVIFPKRGAAILTNKVRINSVDCIMDSNMMSLKPNSDNLNYEYLYYFILFQNLSKIADTSSIPQINNKHIIPYPFLLPNQKEQSKIDNFLCHIDEKINRTENQIQQTLEWKKGLLQNMYL